MTDLVIKNIKQKIEIMKKELNESQSEEDIIGISSMIRIFENLLIRSTYQKKNSKKRRKMKILTV